jgi:TRAP transporter 4TM/12TM fusion protein
VSRQLAPAAGAQPSSLPGTSPAAGAVSPVVAVLAVALTVFTLVEVNYPMLRPQSELAIFALLGLAIGFLTLGGSRVGRPLLRALDVVLALALLLPCGWLLVQTEPAFSEFWVGGISLGDRAGAEHTFDFVVAGVGLVLVLVITRRAVGWALPILSAVFLLYAAFGRSLPDWLFPHRGYPWDRIVSQTVLHSQGIFGIALDVMFRYVFLFVVFGALLEASGATSFVIGWAHKLLGRTVGGPAKVSVVSSGLMGSMSGSAVANTATTGTFTIPLMRSAGFPAHVAGGVEAAASSGGALAPPVMGAGAYMMLELVSPPVTYLEIIRGALIPAILYYMSLFLLVHFYAQRVAARPVEGVVAPTISRGAVRVEGVVFFGALTVLVVLLLMGNTVFRAVTAAMAFTLVVAALHSRTRIGPRRLVAALVSATRSSVTLIAAAACVGIVLGVVTLTGAGTRLPALLLPLAENSLILALLLLMVSSIVLGMGLPSAVCYLLLATLVGPVLGDLGVVPLAAHMFIFYFGMMSMVTPPVALAGYTAASIAGAPIMQTSLAAFRFALVGFTLPFMFVFRPELLFLSPEGDVAPASRIAIAVVIGVLGIVPLAAAVAGYFGRRLRAWEQGLFVLAAMLLLWPIGPRLGWLHDVFWVDVAGAVLLALLVVWTRAAKSPAPSPVARDATGPGE